MLPRPPSYEFSPEEEQSLLFYQQYDHESFSTHRRFAFSSSPPFSSSPLSQSLFHHYHTHHCTHQTNETNQKDDDEDDVEYPLLMSGYTAWKEMIHIITTRCFRRPAFLSSKLCQLLSQHAYTPLLMILKYPHHDWDVSALMNHPEWTQDMESIFQRYACHRRPRRISTSSIFSQRTRIPPYRGQSVSPHSLWSLISIPWSDELLLSSIVLTQLWWEAEKQWRSGKPQEKKRATRCWLKYMYHPQFPLSIVWTYPDHSWDWNYLWKYREWSVQGIERVQRFQKVPFFLFSKNPYLTPSIVQWFLGEDWDWKFLAIHPHFPPQDIWNEPLLFPRWKWKHTYRHPKLNILFWKTTLAPALHHSVYTTLLLSNMFQYSKELQLSSFLQIMRWMIRIRYRQRILIHLRYVVNISHFLPPELFFLILSFVSF